MMAEESFPCLDLPNITCELAISSGLLLSHCSTVAAEWLIRNLQIGINEDLRLLAQRSPSAAEQLLYNLSKQCAEIITFPQALPLVESIVSAAYLFFQSHPSTFHWRRILSHHFISSVTEPIVVDMLSSRACGIIWSMNPTAFEQELCRLVARVAVLPEVLNRDMTSVIEESQLPMVCAHNVHLMLFASEFFKVLLLLSKSDEQLHQLLAEFTSQVLDVGRQKSMNNQLSFFPTDIGPLASMLIQKPHPLASEKWSANSKATIETDSFPSRITAINQHIFRLISSQPELWSDLWMVLHQFPSWHSAALLWLQQHSHGNVDKGQLDQILQLLEYYELDGMAACCQL